MLHIDSGLCCSGLQIFMIPIMQQMHHVVHSFSSCYCSHVLPAHIQPTGVLYLLFMLCTCYKGTSLHCFLTPIDAPMQSDVQGHLACPSGSNCPEGARGTIPF